jgi:hypothetical protein
MVSKTPLHDILFFQQYSRPSSFASHRDHLDSVTNSNHITSAFQLKLQTLRADLVDRIT